MAVDPYILSLNITPAHYKAKKEASVQQEQLRFVSAVSQSQNIPLVSAVNQILALGEKCGYGTNNKEACVARLVALRKKVSN